jgi:hypothetical protein
MKIVNITNNENVYVYRKNYVYVYEQINNYIKKINYNNYFVFTYDVRNIIIKKIKI